MIKYLTGGDICYGMPVNTIGLTIIVVGIVLAAYIAGFATGKTK